MLDKLLDFVISCLKVFQFWVVIYPYERGIRLRLGKLHRMLNTGFHWCLPLKIDRVITIDVVLRTLRLGAQSLVTGDGKPVVMNTVVTCYIKDPVKALLEVNSVEHVVDDSCTGLVAAFVAQSSLDYIVKCCSEQDAGLLERCQAQAARYGIEIVRVQFTDVTPSRTLRLLNSTNEAASYWGSTDGKKDRL
jgi:regulator of protease activity HflC (stomatin/prohibitin superfamily)